ncbi:ribonuclease R [Spartinivicinus poritis]|uniref:Ribonuclease R n=1 Tax=Spartinivicinus poritis TaxID=2994640 RepID=A0ABT5U4X0_9GAMM|nr:ribonuclease R [Spartinivicinus sp. A2-2]MDE1461265.1 ribonuclease R [Spartinivicinus sp. A2-2]
MPEWWKEKDPQAAEEAEKYANPIPSRELIMELLEERGAPASHAAICKALDLTSDEHKEALRRRLRAMQRDGQLLQTRRGAFGLASKMDLVQGLVMGHRDGYGFLIPQDGSDDLFLSAKQMRQVLDGDRVMARVASVDRKGKREGVIVEVLERNTQQLVGRYFTESGVSFVVPDNKRVSVDIQIEPGPLQAVHGQYVIVELVEQPSLHRQPIGIVKEVLGDHMAPGMEIDVAIRAHNIPHQWPEPVLTETQQFTDHVDEADKKARHDLRQLPFVTIDGEDAKDFDDAVYCEVKRGGGWRLYVAIADVSHYVKVDGALDKEAFLRGNSVYFPEHVVPMLPEVLSNGLCSLNPKVDRLAMVCEMTVSAKGKLSGYCFYEAVIHSHARLTYNQVNKMLTQAHSQEGRSLGKQFAPLLPHLNNLFGLYHVLRETREKRGAIDFETTETQIVFGENRKIERIIPTERNEAHKLIEECMLCANVATARFLEKHQLPALYRVHEGPKSEKLLNLKSFLGELGLTLKSNKPKPADYQDLMGQIADRPDAHIIQTMLLRSLSQAVYQPENKGHFGLAYKAYTHFTSPIRRYPDLLVHRAIRHVIRSNKESVNVKRAKGARVIAKKNILPYQPADMMALGEHCSMTERRADDATRDVVDWLKCEFIQGHIGETYSGVISAVTGFGIFVELTDFYIEGLVHISNLPGDYYHFDPAHQRLRGERTGVTYRLGDPITVTVARVNLDDKKIDFEVAEFTPSKRKGKHKGKRKEAKSADKSRKKTTKRKSLSRGSAEKAQSGKKKRKAVKADSEKNVKRKNKPKHKNKKSSNQETLGQAVTPNSGAKTPRKRPAKRKSVS